MPPCVSTCAGVYVGVGGVSHYYHGCPRGALPQADTLELHDQDHHLHVGGQDVWVKDPTLLSKGARG